MAITFPASPTNGQVFTSGSKSWQWDGTTWISYAANISPSVFKVDATNARVGVNNQSPAYALDVNGTIEGTQFLQGTDYLSPYQGFRNKIINGDFSINQRGFTSLTTGAYFFDRWTFGNNTGTVTVTPQTFTVGSPAATGYESPNYARQVVSGQSGTSAIAYIAQLIEDVRTFANSTITVSFYARASSGTPKIALEILQNFGTGGSPSSFVSTYAGQATINTSWTRYSITTTIPNINGKTIGSTANTSSLQIQLWTSAGTDFNSRTGSLGIQSNTFDIWGVQVERGSVATPFEQRPIGTELALCQRYYYKSGYVWGNVLGSGFIANNSNQFGEAFRFDFPTTMRATPTLTYTFFNNDNAVVLSTGSTANCVILRETCINTNFPYSSFSFDYVVSAEL
jgi:hypothetical protein